jgi:hypothetical protein
MAEFGSNSIEALKCCTPQKYKFLQKQNPDRLRKGASDEIALHEHHVHVPKTLWMAHQPQNCF